MKRFWISALIMGLLCSIGTNASAITISYTTQDLGGNTWEYSYFVDDYTPIADHGFTIYFDYGLYQDITPISASADWDMLAWDSDLIFGFPEPGAYDALALVDGASLVDPFKVEFTWLGGSAGAGNQYFETYDSGWNILESGNTAPASAPVPEPATFMLIGTGLIGMMSAKKFRKLLS